MQLGRIAPPEPQLLVNSRFVFAAACCAAVLVSCGSSEPVAESAATSTTSTTSTVATTTTIEPTTSSTTSTTTAPSTTLPATDAVPAFVSEISEITEDIAARMTHSWSEGCPVGLDELRHLSLTHWNFDARVATGELIVHADHADSMVQVFASLYRDNFPIERMELVDVYVGDDDLSMAANNTSAFNCREVAWKPGVWSNHAFGTAVDINPLVNPYVAGTTVLPPGGAPFVDRSQQALGGIYPEGVVTKAFADIGWGWGGDWSSAKDWQHFSASGG